MHLHTRASFWEWWRIELPDWLRVVCRWRQLRFVKALGQGLTLTFLVVFAAILPFVPDRSDFAVIGTLIYVQAGLSIAALYIFVSAIILSCTWFFRRSLHPRRNITLWLKGARNVAVGGGIAILASAISFVPDDLMRVFATWIVLSVFLYIWGYLFLDGAFSPKDLQPVTDAEVIDAAVAYFAHAEDR